MMASHSPTLLGGIGEGAQAGLANLGQQQHQIAEQTRANAPHVDSSGPTMRLVYPDGRVYDTEMPTMGPDRVEAAKDRAAAAQSSADAAQQRAAAAQDRANAPHGSWEAASKPDPNDPSKTIYGHNWLPSAGGETKFYPSEATPMPRNSGQAAQSATQWKYNAWIAVHPGDQQGALDFVAGHKAMDPADAAKFATGEAQRELPGASADVIDKRAKDILGNVTSAFGTAEPKPAPAAAAPVLPAVAGRVAGKTMWKAPDGRQFLWNGQGWDAAQ
jgi:hypothetical protein